MAKAVKIGEHTECVKKLKEIEEKREYMEDLRNNAEELVIKLTSQLGAAKIAHNEQLLTIATQRAWIEALLGALSDARVGLREVNLDITKALETKSPTYNMGSWAFDSKQKTWAQVVELDKVAVAK